MHRYWIFAGSSNYPSGGAYDIQSTVFDDKEKAIEYAKSRIGIILEDTPTMFGGDKIEWVHVLDTLGMNVVFSVPVIEENLMSNNKLYGSKVIDTLEFDELLMAHRSALTAEDLHSKSDIVIELAARDHRINQLEAALDKVNGRYEACKFYDLNMSDIDDGRVDELALTQCFSHPLLAKE